MSFSLGYQETSGRLAFEFLHFRRLSVSLVADRYGSAEQNFDQRYSALLLGLSRRDVDKALQRTAYIG